ncbi:MAG: hypothetical protein AB1649_28055 [Chloroflexota bacterium]
MLRAAHEFMESGKYAEAIMAFQQLARTAEERFPERAPMLYLQAGRAAILDGQTRIGIAHLRRGLTLFASQGRPGRMQMLGQRAVEELRSRGLQNEADQITSLLEGNMPREEEAEAAAESQHAILPTHCPSCGAALRPDEVEWINEVTAVCAYCGSPVRGES